MDRYLITGGAGFIGANFVRHVLEHTEAEVLVFDLLTYAGSLENLREVEDHPRYRFVRGDIAERADVRRAFGDFRPTGVFNFAAESHVDRSIDGPGDFVRTNIHGTFELLEAARSLHARDEGTLRFLHVSTDEVYGSLGAEGLFRETTAYAPNSPYAASKASADHLVRAYVHTYGLSAVITNCSNNYGPLQYPEKLIPLIILNTAEGKPLPIYGDGSNVRDWLYVDDHCSGILLAFLNGRDGEKYNIGGHNERTNLQVVERICDLVQKALPPAENPALEGREGGAIEHYRELITFVKDRPGHDQRYAIDSSKIASELGWKARHDFESGLEATVRWYLEGDEWCRAVTRGRYERERLGLGEGAG
ncbi:MAG: dTDP-glucose 4,6-dehydratase [Acidobacteriota bacterium]